MIRRRRSIRDGRKLQVQSHHVRLQLAEKPPALLRAPAEPAIVSEASPGEAARTAAASLGVSSTTRTRPTTRSIRIPSSRRYGVMDPPPAAAMRCGLAAAGRGAAARRRPSTARRPGPRAGGGVRVRRPEGFWRGGPRRGGRGDGLLGGVDAEGGDQRVELLELAHQLGGAGGALLGEGGVLLGHGVDAGDGRAHLLDAMRLLGGGGMDRADHLGHLARGLHDAVEGAAVAWTSLTPSTTCPAEPVIRSLMSRAAWPERWARVLTSEATTAKPLPASPAAPPRPRR